jgi:hypothetical protein
MNREQARQTGSTQHVDGSVKIGVLTFHRCINYGSYWQARCLAEGLRAFGHDTVILDHESRRVDFAEWKCALRPVPGTGALDRAAYRRKMQRFFDAFDTLPLSPRFPLDRPECMPGFDAVVVGSDEVWNLAHPWYGGCPLFYGEGIRAERLLSYAASFGNYDARQRLDPQWSRRLLSFECIAVRDASSRKVIEDAIGIRPELVLDPALQFPLNPESHAERTPNERYVAIYGHGFSSGFASHVRQWAKRRNLVLVSIGYRNEWADRQWIDAGPHEFAHFIAGATAVATNFFHGCVFALRNRKPFVCEGSWYRSNKVHGLMAEVGGGRHLMSEVSEAQDYAVILDEPPAPAIQHRIAELQLRSQRYLDRALALGSRAA